ncbi:amino acid permease [Histoplasma capsulatum var. duboisii H88]|uniref:Amino acid permease n=2 Tax=Ajellomyces capsulatus (strain H88) TaxID=544711 RepID=F0U6H0_AJEC8|nr:amino acid permease [Histoplasma capsulatum var. duboisii H88]
MSLILDEQQSSGHTGPGKGQKQLSSKGAVGGSSTMATIQDDDERLLARIGYKQELRREFSKWSTVSYAISILGVLGSVPATFGPPLAAGGPATAVWCWFIGSFMAMCIASSVAELVSAYPTAGDAAGMRKHELLPRKRGILIFSECSPNCPLVHWVIMCNGDRVFIKHQKLAPNRIVVRPILASIAICVSLLVLTPEKQSAKWVFTNVTNGSGWNSKAFSFLLGFISVAWTMTDYDGTTHMSEETHDAAIRGPIAIQSAILVSGIFGWMLTVTMCFCLSDLDKILDSPTGLPAAQIFLNAGGRTGGTIMFSFSILVQFFTGCSAMLADTRMTYAFARDDALPFSEFFAKVNPYTLTPVNAVWFVVFFSICLNCIAIGSTQTATAIFNITAPALDLSYIAVILAHQLYKNKVRFIEGPFTLGKWGTPLNIISIAWVLFISVVLFFPPTRPITAENMNYAICVAGFIALFSLSWWWLSARRKYTGPRTKNMLQSVETDDIDSPYVTTTGFDA